MAQQLRALCGEEMPVLSGGRLLSIYRGDTWDPPWPKAVSSLIDNWLEFCPHNRLPFPDHIVYEMTVLHLVPMFSYGMLDLVQILQIPSRHKLRQFCEVPHVVKIVLL